MVKLSVYLNRRVFVMNIKDAVEVTKMLKPHVKKSCLFTCNIYLEDSYLMTNHRTSEYVIRCRCGDKNVENHM